MPSINMENSNVEKKDEIHYPLLYKPGSFDPENHFYEKSINSQCNSGNSSLLL
jgi:hypothetical protein